MNDSAARKDCVFPASNKENAGGKEIDLFFTTRTIRHRPEADTGKDISRIHFKNETIRSAGKQRQYIVVAATTREISLRICVRFGAIQGSFFFPFTCISFFCFMVVSFEKE